MYVSVQSGDAYGDVLRLFMPVIMLLSSQTPHIPTEPNSIFVITAVYFFVIGVYGQILYYGTTFCTNTDGN